ncbi:NmrA-like family domain-containing protein [Vanrija pseudolonga]|uniref:NmrA-like family domain-containing protein n=1 Tax=Vanrija pseudolonga TaxID=143232 RepID=A0AAF1BIG7_9TREE|nr:NmrA-like family domain-containing protein [Vanrija pseudolonga]
MYITWGLEYVGGDACRHPHTHLYTQNMAATKNIVVFGGTGQQGSAFIRALGAYNASAPQYSIYLLSRDPSAGSSKRLESVPGVKVVQVAKNYTDEPVAAFTATGLKKGEVHGAFSMQGYISAEAQLHQGIAIADAAKDYGVKHIIYCSFDLPDHPVSWTEAEAKRKIENHIKESGMGYTILGDTDFMDNWLPTNKYMFKFSRTMVLYHSYSDPKQKHQMISTRDIGRAGAKAIHEPEKYLNKKLRLAGDEQTPADIERIYKEVMGKPIETTYSFVALLMKKTIPMLGQMAEYFDQNDHPIPLEETRAILPDVENLREFLERYKAEQAAKGK